MLYDVSLYDGVLYSFSQISLHKTPANAPCSMPSYTSAEFLLCETGPAVYDSSIDVCKLSNTVASQHAALILM